MTQTLTPYTPEYIEKCFTIWYAAGRPRPATIHSKLPEDTHGRVPSKVVLKKWYKEGAWELRADEMDVKAIQIVENDLITQKANMLREQAQIGLELQRLGMEYLRQFKFDTASSAVSAVIRGAGLERSSRGIGELLVKMAGMTDEDLQEEIMKQLTRATDAGQLIEGEILLDKEQEEEESGNTDE